MLLYNQPQSKFYKHDKLEYHIVISIYRTITVHGGGENKYIFIFIYLFYLSSD